jgi:HAD superfamily hydrolase (TIGR01509 family)
MMKTNAPFAILYDCDGTLIDSEMIAGEVCSAALASLGVTMDARTFIARYAGVPAAQTWEMLVAEYHLTLPEGFNADVNTQIHRRLAEELEAIPGTAEAVMAIGGNRAVASSTGLYHLTKNLEKTGLAPLFAPHIYSASQVARGKPAPDVFLFAASQIGADPAETIVIEDSVAGVTAARRAGMHVIGFTGANHGAPDLPTRLAAAGAISVVGSMAALPAAVEAVLNS